MAVTIQMIETKEFQTKAKGYDPEEVDRFLDEIADEFEDMERQLRALRTEAKRVPERAPAPLQDTTAAVSKLLENAQRVSDDTINDARKQADAILADAKARADRLVVDARGEATKLKDSMETLRSAANDYRARFKRLLDDQMHVLSSEGELFK
ncbi:MAG: DivIVA domain-containing protein [Oscillospiraceae bacterium]|jgi:cell division initiation protein|nr:DivIVA domain-containing protein [Oscillospiraceae bacterium]